MKVKDVAARVRNTASVYTASRGVIQLRSSQSGSDSLPPRLLSYVRINMSNFLSLLFPTVKVSIEITVQSPVKKIK